LTGIAAGGIALLLTFFLLRQTTAPLRALNEAAQKISQGDLSHRVTVHSDDEFGHVARSFNQMASSLEKTEQVKRNMIADIAHELRTPISIVRAGLEGLMDGVLPATGESFAGLHTKTLLISRLVDDLHQLALADAGQLAIHKTECDLRELLRHIETTVGAQLEDQQIQWMSEIPPDLPSVQADVQRMEQVLLNLLSNAMRYTPVGGVIRVKAFAIDNRQIQVSVCDSGPGIPEDALPHVFDRFYREDKSRARSSGGSGLGLAIAKALIEAHNGRIWAENAPGSGTCFHFTLPLVTS
jgi:signal transduction histidine kinase